MGVLVLSNHADETADYLCSRMAESGVEYTRVDTENVASTCAVSASPQRVVLSVNNASVDSVNVHAIWYRRPKAVAHIGSGDVHDRAFAAAEWTAAIEGFLAHVPVSRWINHPSHIMTASSKLEQLARAAQYGLNVPSWLCTSSPHEAIRFFREQDGRIIAKPLYSGYIEREASMKDTVIYTARVSEPDLAVSGVTLGAPTLFQREVTGGVDVRITMVDDDAVAVGLSRDDGEVDIRRNNMAGVRYSKEDVPSRVQSALHSLVRSYGLRFAAIDMMVVQGEWHFLEINPNGQWACVASHLDPQLPDAISRRA